MSPMRSAIIALLGAALLVLAGCSGPGGGSSSGKGGGYYKDDGPGGNIPADIEAIPNATPRIEKHAKANFRPYVVFGKRYVPVRDRKSVVEGKSVSVRVDPGGGANIKNKKKNEQPIT